MCIRDRGYRVEKEFTEKFSTFTKKNTKLFLCKVQYEICEEFYYTTMEDKIIDSLWKCDQ